MLFRTRYNILFKKRRKEYKLFNRVYCPCLSQYINFNSDGFNHLRFKVDGTPRNPKEQMYKMGLLPLVIPVIKNATQVQDYRKMMAPIGRKKIDGKKNLKEVKYWSLIAVVGRRKAKVKVIIRKIGTGKLHFWSVCKLE